MKHLKDKQNWMLILLALILFNTVDWYDTYYITRDRIACATNTYYADSGESTWDRHLDHCDRDFN